MEHTDVEPVILLAARSGDRGGASKPPRMARTLMPVLVVRFDLDPTRLVPSAAPNEMLVVRRATRFALTWARAVCLSGASGRRCHLEVAHRSSRLRSSNFTDLLVTVSTLVIVVQLQPRGSGCPRWSENAQTSEESGCRAGAQQETGSSFHVAHWFCRRSLP